jgi:hypothetical protein
VVGISSALFCATMLGTLEGAITAAARNTVGADARVDGDLPAARIAALRRVHGVAAVAGVQHVTGVPVQGPHVLNDTVSLLLADTVPLRSIRTAVPRTLSTAGTASGSPVPIAVSADLRDELRPGDVARLGGVAVRVVGVLPADSALGPTRSWILADARFAPRLGAAFHADLALLRTVRSHSAAGTGSGLDARLRHAAPPGATVTTLASDLAGRRAEPVVQGARVVLVTGTVLPAVLAAIAIVLSVLSAAGARGRTAGILPSLGMPRRRVRALVAWELGPPGFVALVAGTGVGALLAAVLIGSIDLTPFVGAAGPVVPPDAGVAAGIVGGFAVITAISGAAAVLAGGSRHPARAVKMGAE